MKWIECGHKIISMYGQFQHRVWPAHCMSGFYATSSLDTHGPYKTSKEAIDACEAFEQESKSHRNRA